MTVPMTGEVSSVVGSRLSDARWECRLDEPILALSALPCGVAAGTSEGTVAILDDLGEVRHRLDLGDALLALAASPDGTRVAATGISSWAVWNTLDGTPLARSDSGWSAAATWSARSDQLAVGEGRCVRLLDRDGAPLWRSEPLTSTVAGMAWVRGGRRVAAAVYQGVHVLEPKTSRTTNILRAPGAIAGVAVAPSGRWVVGGSQDATLHGWKLPDGSDFRMSGFPTTVSLLAFEDSGRWLACDGGEAIACWDFSGAGPTGRSALVLSGHTASVTALSWLPGQKRVLVSGDADGGLAYWLVGGHSMQPGTSVPPSVMVSGESGVAALATTQALVYVGRRDGRVAVHRLHPAGARA